MGSNPTGPIKSTIRKTLYNMMKQEEYRDKEYRDLYKRDTRLRYWIDRVKHEAIPDSDKEDILRFIEHMQREEKSKLWIIRCITLLLKALLT